MQPRVPTKITQHTLWQALTGELPPLALPASPIAYAALDSRDVSTGDLFVALPGQNTDGHRFVAISLQQGAAAVLCEERGRRLAEEAGAAIVDCRRASLAERATVQQWESASTDQLANVAVAYIVDDSIDGLQRVGGFQRLHRSHPDLTVVGITGSVGKTSTKELVAAVLGRHYNTLYSRGNLNSEQGLPLTMLELDSTHERAVLEMAMYDLGEIHTLCTLARPRVGVLTNVGPSHLSRLGTIERVAAAKSELVKALPSADNGGIAILNWDDKFVRSMADLTDARIFRYGLTPEADLWASEIRSGGMEGIRFRFHFRTSDSKKEESLHVRVPLLGRHSVHTALRAAAVGLVEGLSWEEIIAGMQSMPGQLRLVVVAGINGSTIIDDTYNASPESMIAALNLLNDMQQTNRFRRVAVLGDMRELGHYTDEGHKIVGRRAADVVDMLITVGELGNTIGEEALNAGFDPGSLYMTSNADEAIKLLYDKVRAGDLVLVKGSRAVGMDTIVNAVSVDEDSALSLRQQESRTD